MAAALEKAMGRMVVGVLAASIAAPFIFALLVLLFAVALVEGFTLESTLLLAVFTVGASALIQEGLILFPGAAIIAYYLKRSGTRSPWVPILYGAVLGPTLVWLMSPNVLGWEFMLPFAIPPGAICGWVYWRIAIHAGADDINVKPWQEVSRR